MKTYTTYSEKETRNLAGKIAKQFTRGVIALTGQLGTGKTIFVQGFAKELGIKEKIISPTFVLIRQHEIPKSGKILYQIDLYRLENIKDLKHLGLEEILSNPDNVTLIEWAEKAKELLPKDTTWVSFESLDETVRKITIY